VASPIFEEFSSKTAGDSPFDFQPGPRCRRPSLTRITVQKGERVRSSKSRKKILIDCDSNENNNYAYVARSDTLKLWPLWPARETPSQLKIRKFINIHPHSTSSNNFVNSVFSCDAKNFWSPPEPLSMALSFGRVGSNVTNVVPMQPLTRIVRPVTLSKKGNFTLVIQVMRGSCLGRALVK
jgi:hypothetical protein